MTINIHQFCIDQLILELPVSLHARKDSIQRLVQQELKRQLAQQSYSVTSSPILIHKLKVPSIQYHQGQTDLNLAKQLAKQLINLISKKIKRGDKL